LLAVNQYLKRQTPPEVFVHYGNTLHWETTSGKGMFFISDVPCILLTISSIISFITLIVFNIKYQFNSCPTSLNQIWLIVNTITSSITALTFFILLSGVILSGSHSKFLNNHRDILPFFKIPLRYTLFSRFLLFIDRIVTGGSVGIYSVLASCLLHFFFLGWSGYGIFLSHRLLTVKFIDQYSIQQQACTFLSLPILFSTLLTLLSPLMFFIASFLTFIALNFEG
jgi:hypothetical protein